jgi:TetR/AcrR family acrAB operon transcriptional repressor
MTSARARPETRTALPAERKRRIDEIGEESRRRILDAAEELFAERGFERTSFVDIAERSGISRGSIPWHFANKDGLLLAVVERALARRTIESKSVEHGDIGELLEDIKQWMHHPTACMLYTLLTEALSSNGGVHQRFVDFHRRGRANLAALIEANGVERTGVDADVLASLVNGALIGLHLQWKLDQRVDLDAGLDLLGRLIKRALPTDEGRAGAPAPRRRRTSRRPRAT